MKAQKQYFFAVLVLIMVTLGFLIYKDFLLLRYLFVYTDMKDMLLNVWPKYVHLSEYLRTSGFPTWTFNFGLGYNFFAGGLTRISLVDPFVWLLMIPNPHHLVYYLPYVLLLKIVLAGGLFYYYLLKIKMGSYTAIIGALLYAFSGYSVVYGGWYDFSTEAVFLPILLLAIESFIQDKGNWYKLTLCYFWLALYNPVLVYFYAVIPALYFFFRQLTRNSWRVAGRLLLNYVGYLLLGVGMGFIFFGPNFFTMMHSPRVFDGSFGLFKLNSSLEYLTIIGRTLSNDFFGTGSAFHGWRNYMEAPMYYTGLLALLLSTQPWQYRSKRERVWPLFLVAFSVLYLVFPFFRGLLNGLSGNYYRLTGYIIPFTLIYLLVTNLTQIFRRQRVNKTRLTLTYLGLIIIAVGLAYWRRDIVNLSAVYLVVKFLTGYYLLFVLYNKRINQPLFAVLLLVTVSLELAVFSLPAVNRPALKPEVLQLAVGYYDNSSQLINEITAQDTSFYRIDKDFVSVFCCNDSFMQNYKGTGYYDSFGERSYIDFLLGMGLTDSSFQYRSFGVFDNHNYIKELIGVKYGIYKKNNQPFEGYKLVKQLGEVSLYENTYFSSIGFVYDQYVPEQAFNQLDNEATNNSYNSAYLGKEKIMLSAVVMGDDQAQQAGLVKVEPSKVLSDFSYSSIALRNQQNAVKVDYSSQKKITGKFSSAKGGLLYLNVPYNDGWQLKIDGKKVPIMKVNLGFIGTPVSPGSHQIELHYQEPYIYPSLTISLIGLGIFGGLILRQRRS